MTLVPPSQDLIGYEQPVIAGNRWPGTARVEGCEREWDWQVDKAKGTEGASTTLQGSGLAEPKITFKMWRGWDGLTWVDYFSDWPRFKQLFEATVAGKDPSAIVIEQPQFFHNRIRGVVLKKMGDLKFVDDNMAEVTVELLEFAKPKPRPPASPKAAAKGKGGAAAAGGAGGPAARQKTDVELEIDKVNKENDALLAKLKE